MYFSLSLKNSNSQFGIFFEIEFFGHSLRVSNSVLRFVVMLSIDSTGRQVIISVTSTTRKRALLPSCSKYYIAYFSYSVAVLILH